MADKPLPIDPLSLAQALIRCPSVTPREAGALQVLEKALQPLGFRCERLAFGEGEARVENLYARWGNKAPNFCFAGHTDVVPPGDLEAWAHDPFAGVIADGQLKGRGAADMKGAIASFVGAAAAFLQNHDKFSGSISLLITGDEEGVAINGTVKMLQALAEKGEVIDACVVGEPSSVSTLGDMIKIGRRGSLNAEIIVEGVQGHVAYPDRADNPVPRLLKFLNSVTAYKLDDGTDAFPPSNLEVTNLHIGNDAVNIIPATARARLNIRFNDRHTGESLSAWLQEAAQQTAGRHKLIIQISGEAFLTAPGPLTDHVVAAIQAETGLTPALSTGGGTSDARFIARYAPVVEFGLVGASMHKVDEQVPAADVNKLAQIYQTILTRYFVM